MYRIFICFGFIAALFFGSCGDASQQPSADSLKDSQITKEQLLDSINKEETKMRASKTYVPQQAMSALRLYIEFTNRFPDDTMTAEYLFRASDIASGLGNYQQQVDFLETIIENHPEYDQYDAVCFSAALTYDDHLENVNFGADRAIQLYDYVIEKYPNSSYAESAKTLKEFVGKPDSVYDNYLREQMKANESH